MINWGVIGVGSIAHRFIASMDQFYNGKIIALASKNPETKERYQDVRIYTNYDAILSDKDIDAIYIATPHLYHAEWALKALEHGKHVMCEKPATLSPNNFNQIIQTANKHERIFFEALKTRFMPAYIDLQNYLSTKQIESIETVFKFDAPKTDARYLYDPKQGGALYDIGSYLYGFSLGLINERPTRINQTFRYDETIDTSFCIEYQTNTTDIRLIGSIIDSKETFALIKTSDHEILVPNFHRPTSYIINGITKDFTTRFDDMYYEIAAFHELIETNSFESSLYPLEDSLYIINEIDKIKHTTKKMP